VERRVEFRRAPVAEGYVVELDGQIQDRFVIVNRKRRIKMTSALVLIVIGVLILLERIGNRV
jgi:hypothetical protein